MTRHYTCTTPPDETPAPCYPERPRAICAACMRYRVAVAMQPEQRHCVIIDGSLFGGSKTECPMYAARPSVRHFAEVDHA